MSAPVLPLTAFEELVIYEDRPAYPWSIFVRLRFSGRIRRETLEAAVKTIMPRHPLLTSHLQTKGRRRYWVAQPGRLPEIVWSTGPPGETFPPTSRQDLLNEIGLRVFVVESDEACDVTLQFHHACCDGGGMVVLLNDLLIAYALASGIRSPGLRLPPLDPTRLARRRAYGLAWWKLLKLAPKHIAVLGEVRRFFSRTPAPLVPYEPVPAGNPAPADYPATHTHTFTAVETAALHRTATRCGVTTNDLLTRDLFLALGEWRARNGSDDDAWLRIMVPVNLRSSGDRLLPAANMVAPVYLERRRRDFRHPDKLLTGIAEALRYVKEWRLGLLFIYALHGLRYRPGGLERYVRQDRCTTSSTFTNMGRVVPARCPLPRDGGKLIVGDLILERIEGVAPIRPYNCAAFCAIEYARRLTITLQYDPRPITPEQAHDLVETFARRVRAIAA